MVVKDPGVIASLIASGFTGRSILTSDWVTSEPLATAGNVGSLINGLAQIHGPSAAIVSTLTAPMILAAAIDKFSRGQADLGTYADVAGLLASRTGNRTIGAVAVAFSVGYKIGSFINEKWGEQISDAVWNTAVALEETADAIRKRQGFITFRQVLKNLTTAAAFPKDSPYAAELSAWIEEQKKVDAMFVGVDTTNGYNREQLFGPIGQPSETTPSSEQLWTMFRAGGTGSGNRLHVPAFGPGTIPGFSGPLPNARIDTPWMMVNGQKICLELTPRDPLVLDLAGDGIQLSGLESSSTNFDMDNNSSSLERTGWVDAEEGLLAIDINENGKIDGVNELLSEYFGVEPSKNSDVSEKRFDNGFSALRSLDANEDGIFDEQDKIYGKVSVWVDEDKDGLSWDDANGNGEVDPGEACELASLSDLNIESISLSSEQLDGVYQSGNKIAAVGSFVQAGVTKQIAAVEFRSEEGERDEQESLRHRSEKNEGGGPQSS